MQITDWKMFIRILLVELCSQLANDKVIFVLMVYQAEDDHWLLAPTANS